MRRSIVAVAVALAFTPAVSQGAVIQWTDWTASDLSSATGSAGGVGVSFRGELVFAQLANGVMVGGGANANTDYWIENAPAPYTNNSVVGNRPPGYELLAFNLPSTNTLVFSSPVVNPLMAIVSQGQAGVPVSYDFDTPFTVLSEGFGFWGDGTYVLGAGDVLTGRELHAVIQFQGTVSQIQWTSTQEFWHGFTVGLAPVPEPGTLGLLLAGLIGLGAAVRGRRP
jgi:hypothetical protein